MLGHEATDQFPLDHGDALPLSCNSRKCTCRASPPPMTIFPRNARCCSSALVTSRCLWGHGAKQIASRIRVQRLYRCRCKYGLVILAGACPSFVSAISELRHSAALPDAEWSIIALTKATTRSRCQAVEYANEVRTVLRGAAVEYRVSSRSLSRGDAFQRRLGRHSGARVSAGASRNDISPTRF